MFANLKEKESGIAESPGVFSGKSLNPIQDIGLFNKFVEAKK